MPDQDVFHAAIEALLQHRVAAQAKLIECQQLSAGASQETYRVRFQGARGVEALALRRAQPTAQAGSAVSGMTLETEAQVIEAAHTHGIPTPRVIYTLQERDALGHGFLMQWLEGETLGQRIVAAEELENVRGSLARSCGEILGKIHAIDWQQAGLDKQLPVVDPAALVEETYQVYVALNVPQPMIDYTWRWLRENLPDDSRTTLVHGDFRNGNLMVTPAGINAVLDWELAHIGDPLRDLGWLCVNSWRFGKSQLPVGGFGEIDDLLAGYQETSGVEVSPEALTFWQVFGSFWWAVVTLQMANSWRTGETPSLERPVIGRRSSEAQMDCVNLLFPGAFELPPVAQDYSVGTTLPMPGELLQGVIGFLKADVAPAMDAHKQFLARVAANSLRIAQREFHYGGSAGVAEQQRLLALLRSEGALQEHNAAHEQGTLDTLRQILSQRLREDMALESSALQAHLRQTVAVQLFIDQPRYTALAQ